MATAGDRLVHPQTGQQITFLETTADTGGAALVVETRLPSGGPKPPVHWHPEQEETFTVLEGSAEVQLGDERRTIRAGDVLTIPAGVPHEMTGDARMRWETRPALRTEEFFERVFGQDMPGPVGLVALASEFTDVFRLASPPWPVQRAALTLLGPLARRLAA